MTAHESHAGSAGLGGAITDTLRSFHDLIDSEIGLLKAETKANVMKLLTGFVAFVFGLVFAIVTATLLVEALVAWLAVVWDNQTLAALVVALGAAAVAAMLFLLGWMQFSAFSPAPERTLKSVAEDARTISDTVTNNV